LRRLKEGSNESNGERPADNGRNAQLRRCAYVVYLAERLEKGAHHLGGAEKREKQRDTGRLRRKSKKKTRKRGADKTYGNLALDM